MTRPALKVLHFNEETGELVNPGCPHIATCEECKLQAHAYEQLQRKYQGALSEIGRLKADPEAEARQHKLWAEAGALFDWWRLATWHPKTRFGAEQFYQALPRLKERSAVDVLRAIAGISFDPATSRRKNGTLQRYDSWRLLHESQEKMDSFAERAPGMPLSDVKWRVWLVRRIESNLKEAS